MKLFGSMNTRTSPFSNDSTLSSGRGSVSDHSKRYENPVQPPPRMPTRSPFGRCARVPDAFLISAMARSDTSTAMASLGRCPWLAIGGRRRRRARSRDSLGGPLGLVIGDGRLDGVLRQHRAVDLHRRQVE